MPDPLCDARIRIDACSDDWDFLPRFFTVVAIVFGLTTLFSVAFLANEIVKTKRLPRISDRRLNVRHYALMSVVLSTFIRSIHSLIILHPTSLGLPYVILELIYVAPYETLYLGYAFLCLFWIEIYHQTTTEILKSLKKLKIYFIITSLLHGCNACVVAVVVGSDRSKFIPFWTYFVATWVFGSVVLGIGFAVYGGLLYRKMTKTADRRNTPTSARKLLQRLTFLWVFSAIGCLATTYTTTYHLLNLHEIETNPTVWPVTYIKLKGAEWGLSAIVLAGMIAPLMGKSRLTSFSSSTVGIQMSTVSKTEEQQPLATQDGSTAPSKVTL